MNKILKLFLNRVGVFGLALVVQLVWLVTFWIKLTQYSIVINGAFTVISALVALWIINKDDNPAYKMAWLILILVFPLFGGILYLAVGNKQPTRKMRRKLEHVYDRTNAYFKQDPRIIEEIKEQDERAAGQMNYVSLEAKYPVYKNTTAEYFKIGEELFESLLVDLKKAEHFIFVEYFIIEEGHMWNSVLEILEQKAKEGLDVRLIYDDMGCVSLLPFGYDRKMEEKGIRCLAFNPFVPFWSLAMNNRDHRKIVVIDGHTAYSGGINMADEYINEKIRFGHWKDTGMCIRGEAVWNFTMMFLQMWNAFCYTEEDYEPFRTHVYHEDAFPTDGYVQPYGDSPLDSEITGENVYLNILNQAKDYVYIFTPYLVVDHEMNTALCLAAKRGVDVRIVMPGIPDKKLVFQLGRSYYTPLIQAGVRIYEYTPGFMHAKMYVCDDEIATVGTINMDFRSLYLHFECGIYLYKNSSIYAMKKDMLDTIEKSRRITLDDCRQGFLGGLLNAVLRVFAPLM